MHQPTSYTEAQAESLGETSLFSGKCYFWLFIAFDSNIFPSYILLGCSNTRRRGR